MSRRQNTVPAHRDPGECPHVRRLILLRDAHNQAGLVEPTDLLHESDPGMLFDPSNTSKRMKPMHLSTIVFELRATSGSQHLHRVLSIPILTFLLLGCSRDEPTVPGHSGQSRLQDREPANVVAAYQAAADAEVAAALAGRKSRGIEDEILRIQADVPTLGGVYFDPSSDAIVAYVKDDVDIPRLNASVRVSALRADPEHKTLFSAGKAIRTVKGMFAFSDLVTYQKALAAKIMSLPDVVSIDADEAANRVAVGMVGEGASEAILSAGDAIGVPRDAIVIQGSKKLPHLTTGLRGTWRPTLGGIQFSAKANQVNEIDAGDCTLGFNVTDSNYVRYALTASHCINAFLGAWGGQTNVVFGQPWAAYPTGVSVVSPSWTNGGCGTTYCVYGDAALISYYGNVSSDKRIMRTVSVGTNGAGGSLTYNGYWNVAAVYTPMYGENVDKVGRTTGWTRGQQGASCLAHKSVINLQDTLTVQCTSLISTARGYVGDSGAPIFKDAWPYAYAIGVLHGATVYDLGGGQIASCDSADSCWLFYTPIGAIHQVLGRTLYYTPSGM